MGVLKVGSTQSYNFDDRVLAHLRFVITNKLMKQESFVFTWLDDGTESSIWLHPSVDLTFEFELEEKQHLNRAWVELLLAHANSPGGLRLVEEPE